MIAGFSKFPMISILFCSGLKFGYYVYLINHDDSSQSTNFGFKETSCSIKQGRVNEIFTDVATKYDLMNYLMSFGIHRLWKDEYVIKIPNLNANI